MKKHAPGLLLCTAALLIVLGVSMLANTFARYNGLFLQRQDTQLKEMTSAADENIAVQLTNFQENLNYVLNRRGFRQAELQMENNGEPADMLYRMEENLITQHPLIRSMLCIRDGKVLLASDGSTDYTFPRGLEGKMQPCFSSDGVTYLALLEKTESFTYAALVDLKHWFGDIARINASDDLHMMLLANCNVLLLHEWQEDVHIGLAYQLSEENCDYCAYTTMIQSCRSSEHLTVSYELKDTAGVTHDMRMTVIPAAQSVNGYFSVGLTGDFDEVIRPMQAAAIRLIIYGGLAVIGVLLSGFAAIILLRHNRRADRELQALTEKNIQTQMLLEKTQTLAHHQRLETIGTLASSIAHEFNNLLTPIMGYSILTLEGLPEDADDLAENVTEIYEASRKAKIIISRMNEMARKNTENTFHPLQLDVLIRKALEVAVPARPNHVQTVMNCAAPCEIVGNETQISQLLLNLILNAFHAMEADGGTLTVSAETETDAVLLRVEDTGTGIPEELRSRVFEPFFTTKEAGRGTGLGLAIVHQVVESHQGSIRVESAPETGTVFSIRFPLPQQKENVKNK